MALMGRGEENKKFHPLTFPFAFRPSLLEKKQKRNVQCCCTWAVLHHLQNPPMNKNAFFSFPFVLLPVYIRSFKNTSRRLCITHLGD